MSVADVQRHLLDTLLDQLVTCALVDPGIEVFRHPCEPVAVCGELGSLVSWWRPMGLDRSAKGCPGGPVALISIRFAKCWPESYAPQQDLAGNIYVALTPTVADAIAVETADLAEVGLLTLRRLECEGLPLDWGTMTRGLEIVQASPVCPGMYYGVQWDVKVHMDVRKICVNETGS